MNEHFSTFLFFFAVIDPIGTVPVFLAVASHYPAEMQQRIAVHACAIAAMVLLFFVLSGEFLLRGIGIPLAAFQIAGGLVLFIFALSMIFGESKPDEEIKLAESGEDTAVFPLAIPSIAGPGAMLAAIMQTEKSRFAISDQIITTLIMISVLVITLILLLQAQRIVSLIGRAGASVVSRVMGLILSAIAVHSVLAGMKSYFDLAA